ncbi:MAG: M23 family metallopeptidase [Desulfovibrio sp.]|uniref:M23 family metallopeptidase n=1 Tax=Desulfovibrio sp. 7SRBS1 TaxID=3378064 RepID=UPI003B40345C
MLFKKYQVVIFREGTGTCCKFRYRSWTAIFLVLLFLGLAASNVYLWQFYASHDRMVKELTDAEKNSQRQKTQLLSLADKVKGLEKDLTRVRDFDSKLRVMLNTDQGSQQNVSSLGGPENGNFSKNYLMLYRQELLARKMHHFLKQLSTESRLEEVRQQELLANIKAKEDILASTPSIWPTDGWISSPFGYRRSPFTATREFHKGLDISSALGTPVYAPARGEVIQAGQDGSYGMSIALNHESGIVTKYAHLSRMAVKKGQTVTRGELIGYVGSTGRSTGPHLHYEVRLNGVPVNPLRYILN